MLSFNSCGNWLDVVPEGVATIEMAFESRVQTRRYLTTCYSFMPNLANPSFNPTLIGCDEMWIKFDSRQFMMRNDGHLIATGMQNATNPILSNWEAMYQALRDCNVFLENVYQTPDLSEWERNQWIAEVKVLKAYYHFCLVQMYGPVPLIRENLPVSVDVSKVKVVRNPVDECFQYIVDLLDEATEDDMLPMEILDPEELGRITKPIAMALKAKVLVTAASPLFNGNTDQTTLRNRDDTPLFNSNYDETKWQKALTACKKAIEICHEAGLQLYSYNNIRGFTDIIATDLTLRNAVSERWNSEIIWANTQSIAGGGGFGTQSLIQPKLNPAYNSNTQFRRVLNVPLKIASLFYTQNGVPLEEDITRNTDVLFNFRTPQSHEELYIKRARATIDLHFDREPRFYAWLGFDGGIWFGAGREDDKNPDGLYFLGLKLGESDGTDGAGLVTGYLPKKLVHYQSQLRGTNSASDYSCTTYPWPIMRLSDLYLLYAEAINETEGPTGINSAELFKYIDMVRIRAGLKSVKESWDMYTNYPKYDNRTGMRQIIQQERMIELSFEGHRFWDIRRWKTAPDLYRTSIEGWYLNVAITDGTPKEVNELFYTRQMIFQQKFGIRDYFWPIRNSDISVNPNLVQNIGW